ncbi:phosphotriesterase-related protein [Zerene cesonia]|uniref:phosphotriesterase-related protein n=1 Tax=Zerene cesonia TaxID=33412 RepID=UPI0018E59F74|nr:phosphotriesterase-related protein [Zerene cesonia]
MSAKVQTVLGDIHPSALGRTLTHEHLSMEFTHFYREPPKKIADKFQTGFSLENVGFHRQYPYSSENNLILNDLKAKEAVLNDVLAYKKYGGGTIVENTTEGIKRDIDFYKEISEKSNVHIIAGTGYYIADVQNNSTMGCTTEDMYNHMLKEFTEGCVDYPTVKAGFLGEIASVWPIKEFERKAIKAAGEVQAQIGCGVSFHPHREPEAPFEIIRLYAEAGGKVDKTVMSHLDRTLLDFEKLSEFSELGTYCQFDLFGVEVSYYQLNIATDMPSDAQRLNMIKGLVDDGKENRVLMSHDVHTKHRLIDFGGHGYCHIINNVLPQMKAKGFSQTQIDKITIENPAEWLTIRK